MGGLCQQRQQPPGSAAAQPLSCLPLLIRGRLFISMHDGQVQSGCVWVAQGSGVAAGRGRGGGDGGGSR